MMATVIPVHADTTAPAFQAAFMHQPPGQQEQTGAIALEHLAAQTPLPPGRYRVAVRVNAKPLPDEDIEFVQAIQGTGLSACLTPALLERFGVREQALETPLRLDDTCIDLAGAIPHARVDFEPSDLRLSLSIPQIALRSSSGTSVPPERWDSGINAAFVNYQATAQQGHGRRSGSTSSKDLYLHGGLNVGDWRLRSQLAGREGYDGRRRWTRTNTYAQRDLPGLRANLTLGQTFSNASVFRSFAFTGARLASDSAMLSSVDQQYAPVIRGFAQTRAKIEILRDGFPLYSTYVAPGAYAIDDLVLGGGQGELEVVVTEADGQVKRYMQPYSSLGDMLREGVWRYSALYGTYDNATDSSGPRVWQSTAARGLPWRSTLYGGVLASDYYQAVAAGVAKDFGELGAFSFDITQANADIGGEQGKQQGQSYSLRYSKRFDTATSLRFAGYRYSTEGYRDLDEAVRQRDRTGHWYGSRRSRLESSIYQNIGIHSALSLTFSHEDYWQTSRPRQQYQLQFSTQLDNVGISLYASQALDARGSDSRLFGLSLSLPLDFGPTRQQASFSTQHSRAGHSEQASLSGALPVSGMSYHTALARTQQGGRYGNLSLAYRGSQGNLGVGYSEGTDYRSLSLNASGALLVHGDGIALGSQLGETAALVHVPDTAGVGVRQAASARTDSSGYLLVPSINPYQLNELVLDTDALSPEVVIENGSQQVVPRRGAIVKATFASHTVMRLVLTLHTPDGEPLPFGAHVSDPAGAAMGVVGQAGQTLIAVSQSGPQRLSIAWGEAADSRCDVVVDAAAIPVQDGFRLKTLTCLPGTHPRA